MKTSTQWLFEKLWETPPDKLTWYAILQQAMDMEKKQIIQAFNDNLLDGLQVGEQYYNETYKNK